MWLNMKVSIGKLTLSVLKNCLQIFRKCRDDRRHVALQFVYHIRCNRDIIVSCRWEFLSDTQNKIDDFYFLFILYPVHKVLMKIRKITFKKIILKLCLESCRGNLLKLTPKQLTALHSASTCKACNFLFTSCVRTRNQLSKFALLKNFLQ